MRLKEIRFKKGITQMRLALISNVLQCRISAIENNLVKPRIDEKLNLENALCLSGAINWE